MNPKLQGEVTLIFIRAGISKKGNPYLQCSNGRAEIFLTIPNSFEVDENTFSAYNEDDPIELEVATTVGTDSVHLVRLID